MLRRQHACTEQSIERGRRSERYSTGCLRDIKGGVRALSETLSAAHEASATAAWDATADAKGRVCALSIASRAASDASATATWAVTAIERDGLRALSEALSAASEASATAL